jgi:hypothetical protein
MNRDLILQIRELFDRHLDVIEIAHRLHIDPSDVILVIELVKQVVL